MYFKTAQSLPIFTLFLLGACSPGSDTETKTEVTTVSESQRLNEWFQNKWQESLARSPEFKTSLGMKSDNHLWDNVSDEFTQDSHAILMANLNEMRQQFDYESLDVSTKLSYRLFEYRAEQAAKRFPYRKHRYVFSQFRGPHSSIPAFLANQHRVDTAEDAEAYVTRLEGLREHIAQYETNARDQFNDGITLPQWSYDQMINTSRNAISGTPFDDGEPNTLLADLTKKVEALEISDEQKSELISRGTTALLNSVKPAYESLVAMFEEHKLKASGDDGAWKLPEGDSYYGVMLETMTTTDMSAKQIHELGLSEVSRIHNEMSQIRDQVGFDGSLQDFFVYMRTDPDRKFTYDNTDVGRDAYLEEATTLINVMRSRLDELFFTKPEADFTVKRVEAFRERAAGKAFYQRPAADGSRPGIYYANLYNMEDMPKYQMEALAYHEGIPGHHMQIAIQQELEGIPMFRRFGRVTAYSEGWGLYSEYIPKEMGFYSDPYSDFGRLAMELWRAARLVVDTGIHDKRWTRDEAIQYLLENTPNPKGDCIKAIERYVVMPGQATAYKVGMLKILALREIAQQALGDKFDIRGFHDVVLANGPVPLSILESLVEEWIQEES